MNRDRRVRRTHHSGLGVGDRVIWCEAAMDGGRADIAWSSYLPRRTLRWLFPVQEAR